MGKGMISFLVGMSALLAVSMASAGERPRLAAVLDRLGDGVHDLRGQRIRCTPAQRIGVRLSDQQQAVLQGDATTTFEGCDVAIQIDRGSLLDEAGERVKGRVEVRGFQITAGGAGVLINSSEASFFDSNTFIDLDYGAIIMGHKNVFTNNVFRNIKIKGIYVSGHANVLDHNGFENDVKMGTGIHVLGNVPMNRPPKMPGLAGSALWQFAGFAMSNQVSYNAFRNFQTDLWDSTRNCSDQPEEWTNVFTGNAFTTAQPSACMP